MSVEATLTGIVMAGVQNVMDQSEFAEWLAVEPGHKDGHIGINNSFLFREELATVKNDKYLCVPLDDKGIPKAEQVCLASHIKFNSKFAYVSAKDKQATYEKLDTALTAGLDLFGQLPFILIGTVTDDVVIQAEVDHKLFAGMVLNPLQKELVIIEDEVISLREALDEEAIWAAVEEAAGAAKIAEPPLPVDLQKPFAKALGELRSNSYALVHLPSSRKHAIGLGLLGDIAKVLNSQIVEYSKALARIKGDPEKNSQDFNSVLRISYNFSSDATKILRLLISLGDLKPVLLWCTVAEWSALSECFQKLPWSKSTTKPSLDAYHKMIGGVRNRSFHNLFPFSKTLKVPLDGVPLGAISLTFFSEFGGRKNLNRFEYQDQALIEAFTEFTRAGEKFVPFSFWTKNLAVMSKTVELLEATADALRIVAKHK